MFFNTSPIRRKNRVPASLVKKAIYCDNFFGEDFRCEKIGLSHHSICEQVIGSEKVPYKQKNNPEEGKRGKIVAE
jgi:hypothetical protein